MLANWITLSRFPILMTTVLALYLGSPKVRLAGVALLFVVLSVAAVFTASVPSEMMFDGRSFS